jgi:hypothetical protein
MSTSTQTSSAAPHWRARAEASRPALPQHARNIEKIVTISTPLRSAKGQSLYDFTRKPAHVKLRFVQCTITCFHESGCYRQDFARFKPGGESDEREMARI